ncbi:oxygenase MpaB family protein [Cryobacterium sp. PH31-L1]|uniref:oxygenase MpaB family protein n=1 Tax=Cryobacterium sp. PH31-L1 TaxID=3046199 RepID=UPI0024BA942D|nr:oxygenase MpaB family protein [Cryobacterium sp. PH31-L1]MDJ0377889.1 oxygenase MpaB family protein [Cryobacterium sp. PH31-L1]
MRRRRSPSMQGVAGEGILIAAGGRAILLQLANPPIGHGVADHSDFAARPLDRLNGTLSYVYAIVFGNAEQAEAMTARVNHAHGPVHSEGTTPKYNAFTPKLQLWVAATLYESATHLHGLVYGPLDDDTADAVYREYSRLGTSLQVPPQLWPSDRAAFGRYWNEQLALLTTDAATRAVAHELLHSRTAPLWYRAALPLARLMTAGLLPPEVRRLYDLPWSRRRERRFERVLGGIRLIYPRLPQALRHWPKNHYLRALHASALAPVV